MKHNRKRSLLARTAALAALSTTLGLPGVMGLTAATAHALPISGLQSECRGAGGSWQVEYGYNSTGIRYVSGYECWYKDIGGNQYVDFYDRRGNYTGTG
jgi:hypothetical protein